MITSHPQWTALYSSHSPSETSQLGDHFPLIQTLLFIFHINICYCNNRMTELFLILNWMWNYSVSSFTNNFQLFFVVFLFLFFTIFVKCCTMYLKHLSTASHMKRSLIRHAIPSQSCVIAPRFMMSPNRKDYGIKWWETSNCLNPQRNWGKFLKMFGAKNLKKRRASFLLQV